MKIDQTRWSQSEGWASKEFGRLGRTAQLVFVFGERSLFKNPRLLLQIKEAYPEANCIGCSTAGEIFGTQVSDHSLIATAVQFEHSRFCGTSMKIRDVSNSREAGEHLAKKIPHEGLVHVFVLSDGLKVNGSELVSGLTTHLPIGVRVTGGLSGDGECFQETVVLWNGSVDSGTIAAVGFYGDRLKIGCGSLGGWDSFGPERLITKSKGNQLYELDGKSALELYKTYLGEHAQNLPSAGLLFPLSLRTDEGEAPVVRTILAVNENDRSMTFAGDVPEGGYVRLMKANFDRLIDGAQDAAKTSYQAIGSVCPDLALLISCVGRKLVLKQRVEEEVEAVQDVLGRQAVLAGFYSYGEISPFNPGAKCELHNQTMTITTISEK